MGSLSQYCKTRQTFVATKHRLYASYLLQQLEQGMFAVKSSVLKKETNHQITRGTSLSTSIDT